MTRLLATYIVFPAAIVLLATQSLFAINDEWFGTWKLNRALSRLTVPSITIARIPLGYRFGFGAISLDIGDDGKDCPTVPGRCASLKAVGEREWFRVHKIAGKGVDPSTLKLPPDGKILLVHTVA